MDYLKEIAEILTPITAILAFLGTVIALFKARSDGNRVKSMADEGAAAQQSALVASSAQLAADSTVGKLHYKVPGWKLILRIVVCLALIFGIFYVAILMEVGDTAAYGVFAISGLLLLVALISMMRLIYRCVLFVFLR